MTSPTLPDSPYFKSLLLLSFGLGLLGLILGSLITFIPGTGSEYWFVVSGLLMLGGLLLRNWPLRITAMLLIFYSGQIAVGEHQHGIKYQKKMQARAQR